MRAVGARLAEAVDAARLRSPLAVGLSGDLGAGKTTLVGGYLERLGHGGPVRSPTYTLVEPYRLSGRDVVHCDLYRLRDPDELEQIGLRDMLTDRAVLLVEWPEQGGRQLPPLDLRLELEYEADGRIVTLRAISESGARVLAAMA